MPSSEGGERDWLLIGLMLAQLVGTMFLFAAAGWIMRGQSAADDRIDLLEQEQQRRWETQERIDAAQDRRLIERTGANVSSSVQGGN